MNDLTLTVLLQYVTQALLAVIVSQVLKRLFTKFDLHHFKFWWWSWIALGIYMIGACISLLNIFYFQIDHPFRIAISILTTMAGFLQAAWLIMGANELAERRLGTIKWKPSYYVLLVFISAFLVFSFVYTPDAGSERLFMRVGVRSLVAGLCFFTSALLLVPQWKSGVGIRIIIASFIAYGFEQFNYFASSIFGLFDKPYLLNFPYYLGVVDLLLQTLMAIGMIVSVLEVEGVKLKKANKELDIFLHKDRENLLKLEEKQRQLNILKTKNEENNVLIQERERNKIRREVHDGIGQMTFALRMMWNRFMDRYGKNDDTLEFDTHLHVLIKESRLVMNNLSSFFNDKTTLKKGFEDLLEIAQRDGDVLINLNWSGADIKYGDSRFIHFFRIAQESLNNALKYANATSIKINVDNGSNPSIISLTVTDDGVGFDLNKISRGLGLQGIQERADIISAELKIESKPGEGTTVGLKFKHQ